MKPSNTPCKICGQDWHLDRDIRIVNSRNGYALPEPKHCEACRQILPKGVKK